MRSMEKIITQLHQHALAARAHAYAPYSKFHVGVCILTEDEKLFPGCNVENAAYPLSQCAESGAIATMVVHGYQTIKTILILGSGETLITPCGACRQLLQEFAGPDLPILLADEQGVKQTLTLGDLLPMAFSKNHLTKE
jgi:cytidine deaminase